MISLLHAYHPSSILISFGPIDIHWYGLLIVLGIIAAIAITLKLASYYNIKKETIIDLAFWLIISGVIGARIYFIFLELPYYLKYPLDMFKPWQGGLAIHGAIIGGALALWLYTKKYKLNFWLSAALIAPGLALAQAIGRWGNYFNQELFGKPTNLPWGIPIDLLNRPIEFLNNIYFQPTFLYESLGNFLVFAVLIVLHFYLIKKQKINDFNLKLVVFSYLILYSLLRFFLEYFRIDSTPYLLDLRLAQFISLLIIISSFIYLSYSTLKIKTQSAKIIKVKLDKLPPVN